MASKVSWLAFDPEQQRQTQLIMAALNSTEAIDELGLGVIRDLIAATLHPGLTVLHTRAKYLLFVPRDFSTLTGATTENVAAEARRREVRLIKELRDHHHESTSVEDDRGIIGRRRGDETQNLPSGLYWGLLRRLDILRGPAGSSRQEYFEAVAKSSQEARASHAFRAEDDLENDVDSTWREMPAVSTDRGFAFSYEEADWLGQRFCDVERDVDPERRSLVHWLISESRANPGKALKRLREADAPWTHERMASMPAATREVVQLGDQVNRVAFGARILYNYLCSTGMPVEAPDRDEYVAKYEEAMSEWYSEFRNNPVTTDQLSSLNVWALDALDQRRAPRASRTRWTLAYRFLVEWRESLGATRDPLSNHDAAQTVTRREKFLKPGRERIGNDELLRTWGGESGYVNFRYNWTVAQRVIGDVCEGLTQDA